MSADFTDEDVREDENDLDIIIIGAGLAGLTCAYNILRKNSGLDVLIIEKDNVVGGRILPRAFSETYHANVLQHALTDLLKTLNIQVNQCENTNTRRRVLYTEHGPSQILPKFYGAEVYSFLQMMEELALTLKYRTHPENDELRYLVETSMEELLRKLVYFPYARSLCRAYICSTCAMRDLNDLSAFWLLVVLNGAAGLFNRLKITVGDDNRFFVQGGVSKIVHALLEKISQLHGNITYAESVNEIRYNDDRVYVLTEKNNFRCELVVVAVPPPMHYGIAIEPASQYLLNAELLYTPNNNVFFNVAYKNRLESDNFITDVVTTWEANNNLNIVWDVTHSDSARFMLSGFLAEPNSTQISGKGLFDTLNECFETRAAANFLEYREYDHTSNDRTKYSGSPMSVMKPCPINDLVNCTDLVFERIYFASSEYATHWPGTVDGAIEIGKNIAYSILYRIRPQVLTAYEMSSLYTKTHKTEKKSIPFKICVMQYLGLMLNITIFWVFLRAAYEDT